MNKVEYQFPETIAFRAREATEPEFTIQSRSDWFEELWVDFGPVRNDNYFDRLEASLGLQNGTYEFYSGSYRKAIFSGHRGCGKSVELQRFATRVTGPKAFFTIFVDLEKEANIQQFEPEDLFVALISVLLRTLDEKKVKFDRSEFDNIAEDWIAEEEVKREVEVDFKLAAEAGASLGLKFWNFFSVGGGLKGTFSRDNKTTKTIRHQIKTNPQALTIRLNAALVGVRQAIIESKLGRDLLFVVDGLEKANKKVYDSLFLHDPQLILSIEAHQVLTVPIATFYEIQSQPSREFFYTFYLPMLRVNADTRPLLAELVMRRVDQVLLPEDPLQLLIDNSGGCPRQLLILVNRSLSIAIGNAVTLEHSKQAILEEGNVRYRTFTSKHQEILKSRNFDSADTEVLQLLQSLNILEYNGSKLERKINPLIERFFPIQS